MSYHLIEAMPGKAVRDQPLSRRLTVNITQRFGVVASCAFVLPAGMVLTGAPTAWAAGRHSPRLLRADNSNQFQVRARSIA